MRSAEPLRPLAEVGRVSAQVAHLFWVLGLLREAGVRVSRHRFCKVPVDHSGRDHTCVPSPALERLAPRGCPGSRPHLKACRGRRLRPTPVWGGTGVAGHVPSIQEAIRAQRWLLDAMLEQFPNGAVNVFDRDLRFLYVAGTGLDRIGLRPEHLVGHRLGELFPEIVARVRPFFDRAFAGETVTFPLSVVGREYGICAWPLAEPPGAITAVAAIAHEVPPRSDAAAVLTPRQREIAVLVADGLTNNQIAERMMLAPKTVRNYVGHILRRLSFASRTQVAVWAAASGLYPPGEGDGGPTGT